MTCRYLKSCSRMVSQPHPHRYKLEGIGISAPDPSGIIMQFDAAAFAGMTEGRSIDVTLPDLSPMGNRYFERLAPGASIRRDGLNGWPTVRMNGSAGFTSEVSKEASFLVTRAQPVLGHCLPVRPRRTLLFPGSTVLTGHHLCELARRNRWILTRHCATAPTPSCRSLG